MVSEKQSRRIPSLGSKRYLGVKKQASNRLKYMIKRMNAHDSLLLKSYIQREVRDGVERKFQELLISSGLQKLINALKMKDQDSLQELLFSREKINETGKSGARFLELRFIINNNKLPIMTYTKTNIIPKDEQFQVALFDVRSNSIVNDGPLSSMKIEICPIKSVFECCDDDDWTENEFKDNILHQRENKEPLLVGDRFVTLENGVASISRIVFTDNSGWVKNKKFSLGARAMENGENIKEGRSQAFRVKDVRGESYKKHYHPYLKLKDDVWRLEKIAENGKFHQRLNSKGIHTVKDLLRLLIINESSLREKFGKIQNKCWLAIVEHARSCVVDDYMLYCCYGMSGQPVLLLFNVIYELVGVKFDEQKFYLPDDLTLTPYQKNWVEIVKQDAYKNIEKLNAVDEGILNYRSLEARIKSTREQDLQHIDISAAQGYGEPFISSSNVNHGIENAQINVDPVPDIREVPFISSCDVLNDNFERADWSTMVDLLKSDMEISNNEKPKAVWCKIRAVVKWIMIVRRGVAAKRNEHVFVYKVYDISAIF